MLVVVLLFMPLAIWFRRWRSNSGANNPAENLKALDLPEGSVRAMLALISVGSFIIFLVLGSAVLGETGTYTQAVTAFATLTGAIIGFYFGGKGSSTK